jgi:hypothetical protein
MRLYLFVAFLFLTSIKEVLSQPFIQWGNLKPGDYQVGYKTIIKTDYSRTYGSNPRTIQMYMWYPSTNAKSERNKYGTYFSDVGNDWGTKKNVSEVLSRMLIKDFKSGALNPSFSGAISEDDFQKILNSPIAASRDAHPAPGKFPLVLHIASNGALHQSVMLEYLASHGYVVISISIYGSSPAFYGRGESGPKGLHAMTEDLAFTIAHSKSIDFIDTSKTAMIGMLAQAGISLQMKEELLDAIACLDCIAEESTFKLLPYYEPRRIRLKIMQITNEALRNRNRFAMDSLIYSERFEVNVRGLKHPDFYPFPGIAFPEKAKERVMHELILYNTRLFLDYALLGNGDFKSSSSEITKHEASGFMPTEAEFLEWLRYGRMDQVRRVWDLYGKSLSGQDNFFSVVLFLSRDKSEFANEAFKMYSSAYPDDPRLRMISQFL